MSRPCWRPHLGYVGDPGGLFLLGRGHQVQDHLARGEAWLMPKNVHKGD